MKEYKFDVAEQTEKCIAWIRDFFNKNGNASTRCVIGISGGKDSTVVAALLAKALGPSRVIGVMLPCGNQVDIADSKRVIDNLGIDSYEINIGPAYDALTEQMRVVSKNGEPFPSDGYSTNTPARLRMSALYGVAALVGNAMVANTCNRSEDCEGYSTLFGDSAGSFAPISHLTTEEVIAIGDYLGLPHELTHKTPTDGMSLNDDGSLKSDEDKLGFTYEEVNRVIRLGDEATPHFEEIVKKYKSSNFKLKLIQVEYYDPGLPDYFLEKYGI